MGAPLRWAGSIFWNFAAQFPKKNLQAAYSCDAMQAEIDRTNGAGMTVRSLLPRAS
jgi:hypothetical protein